MSDSRPIEPEVVRQWREWNKAGPPKCCHTCDFYTAQGMCERYNMRPPDDFASTPDVCSDWIMEIPF